MRNNKTTSTGALPQFITSAKGSFYQLPNNATAKEVAAWKKDFKDENVGFILNYKAKPIYVPKGL